jgi:hypothetical protein
MARRRPLALPDQHRLRVRGNLHALQEAQGSEESSTRMSDARMKFLRNQAEDKLRAESRQAWANMLSRFTPKRSPIEIARRVAKRNRELMERLAK